MLGQGGSDSLAYYDKELITTVKCFVAPEEH
jgi:hypothetical protein